MAWLKRHWLKAIVILFVVWLGFKWFYSGVVSSRLSGVS